MVTVLFADLVDSTGLAQSLDPERAREVMSGFFEAATEELQALVSCLSSVLSELESRVLSLYLDGYSYEQIAERLECDTKTVDNALQRVKRKVGAHLASREVAV